MLDNLDNDFWQFSLSLYKLPEVSKCLLHIQDEYDANINCLLLALYAAKCGYLLEIQHWQTLLLATEHEQNICAAARRLRLSLQGGDLHLYQQAKADELKLEQSHQAGLYNTLINIAVIASGKPLAMDNIRSYWQANFNNKQVPLALEALVNASYEAS